MASVSLTAIVVAHESLPDLRRALPPLVAQLGDRDELLVVDNASTDGIEHELPRLAPDARLLPMGANLGFAAAANAGVAAASGDLVVLLNPDAIVAPGWSEAIRRPWGGEFGAWMGLVLLADGAAINTSGGVLHFTGLGWAGQMGQPAASAPRAPVEVGFLSGACLAVPRERWQRAGGFPEDFFMYCEDVDLSLRFRLFGDRLAVAPDAKVCHDYDFDKGPRKWRMLERNRWATVIRTYPTPLLAAVLPALLVTEVAIWAVALRGGWAGMKARATIDVLRWLPRLRRERRRIQAAARISAAEFAEHLTADLSSPYFGAAGDHPLIGAALRHYWRSELAGLRALPATS